MISSSCIEKIRNLVDIYDLVSPYVVLKKCGANWKGLSPFSHEKTPSFFVMPAKKIFRCFSSGYAGDIFRFIQLKENVSFVDAVEMIAKRFNIPVEYEKSSNFQRKPYSKSSLYEINEIVCEIFEKNFHADDPIGRRIREYWVEERKFSVKIARENGIGYAKNDSNKIIKVLLDAKFSIDSIRASGLFFYKEGETDPYKFKLRFRSRLTIPIKDIQGRIAGFSARFINGMSQSDDFSDAKYINSPETDIFHKGQLLFGLHHARQYIEPEGFFWLVEGQFDTIRCWTKGINTALAPQGTAITETQLAILRRYTTNLNCLLDGDSAGMKAAERMLPMALAAGLDTKFFILPTGDDPDSYFIDNFESKFEALKKSGMSAMQFLARRFFKKYMSAMEKAEAISRAFSVITASTSAIVQKAYVEELAYSANLDQTALIEDFRKFLDKKKFTDSPPVVPNVEVNHSTKLDSAENQLLSAVLFQKNVAEKVSVFLDYPFLKNLRSDSGQVLLKILNETHECMWDGLNSLDNDSEKFSEIEKNLIYSAFCDFDNDYNPIEVANMCLKKLFANYVKNQIEEIDAKIKNISLDETLALRNLQNERANLRNSLLNPPKIM